MASIANLQFFSQVDQLVAQYRTSQRKPITTVETKKSTLNTRLQVLADLKTKLSTLKTTIDDLSKTGTDSKFNAYTASSTNTAVATGTASSSAVLGSHTLLVTQVAKNDTVVSDRLTSSATSVVTAEGAGTKTLRLSLNSVNTDVNVALVAGDTNDDVLTKIVNAINASSAGVSASSVSDTATTKKLALISKTTGSSQAVSLSNVSGTLWDKLGLTAAVLSGRTQSTTTTAGYSNTNVTALNSNFTLDGIYIEKQTNSVTDALTGVVLDLKGTQGINDTPVTLAVGVDKTAIKDKITKFITDFNDALKYLNVKTGVDPVNKTRQTLAGDTTFTGLKVDLRNITGGIVSSVQSGNPTMLSSIGFDIARDGTLTLKDSAKFEEMLSGGTVKVSDLFNSANGVATTLKAKLDAMLSSTTGTLDVVTKTTSSQITNLTDQIIRFDARLDKRVEKYRNDFLKIQATLASLTQQQQTIARITSYFG